MVDAGAIPLTHVALAGLAAAWVLAVLVWAASVWRRDVSLVDRFWSALIGSAALVYAALLPMPGSRGAWMLALLAAWGLRLAYYVTRRNWGHGEDRRYQEIRARNQPNFAFKSLYLIFTLQAVIAWVVGAPFLIGMAAGTALTAVDAAGIAVAAFGIVFEAVADSQMASFKADQANKGQVMDRGVWRWSRHPNYFGECCIWWGFWLMALGAAGTGGVWTVISPVIMTVLLLKVSGVALLEKDMAGRRPAYRDYIARTSAFIPMPPRQKATAR